MGDFSTIRDGILTMLRANSNFAASKANTAYFSAGLLETAPTRWAVVVSPGPIELTHTSYGPSSSIREDYTFILRSFIEVQTTDQLATDSVTVIEAIISAWETDVTLAASCNLSNLSLEAADITALFDREWLMLEWRVVAISL